MKFLHVAAGLLAGLVRGRSWRERSRQRPRLRPLSDAVPHLPPDKENCATGWQTAQRVTGSDDGAAYLLESQFDQARVAGRLLRRSLDLGTGTPALGPAVWDAGAVLDSGQPSAAARRILTMGAAGATINFEWPALDDAQRAALDPGRRRPWRSPARLPAWRARPRRRAVSSPPVPAGRTGPLRAPAGGRAGRQRTGCRLPCLLQAAIKRAKSWCTWAPTTACCTLSAGRMASNALPMSPLFCCRRCASSPWRAVRRGPTWTARPAWAKR